MKTGKSTTAIATTHLLLLNPRLSWLVLFYAFVRTQKTIFLLVSYNREKYNNQK